MGDLDNKTIIVAGAGPGLGRETALASFRQGANVVIAARTAARLDAMPRQTPATPALSMEQIETIMATI